jgi:hypothetical protein
VIVSTISKNGCRAKSGGEGCAVNPQGIAGDDAHRATTVREYIKVERVGSEC